MILNALLRLEPDAMREDKRCEFFNIIREAVIALPDESQRLGRFMKRYRAASTNSESEIFAPASSRHDGQKVFHQAVFDSHLFSLLLQIHNLLLGQNRLQFVCGMEKLLPLQNRLLIQRIRVANSNAHQKPI